jgi:hypothetical protein
MIILLVRSTRNIIGTLTGDSFDFLLAFQRGLPRPCYMEKLLIAIALETQEKS